jgi:hypothetical protein
VDGKGKIDIHDLSVALREFGVNQTYAKVWCSCATFFYVTMSSFTYPSNQNCHVGTFISTENIPVVFRFFRFLTDL